MAKIIPYQKQRFQPIDFKRADDYGVSTNGNQLNLFDQPSKEETPTLPLPDKTFDLALKLDLKNDPSAESYYLRAIEKNENIAHSLCNLGVIAAHKQNMSEAVDLFSRALMADPRHCESHFNLANVYFAARNFPLAILHYQIVTKIAGSFADVYFNLGLAFLEIEDLKSANDAFKKYKSLLPEEHPDPINVILKSLSGLL
ncbi:MAG: tetratricopeptide repeat protein [Saprospiraceae bacterium]